MYYETRLDCGRLLRIFGSTFMEQIRTCIIFTKFWKINNVINIIFEGVIYI